MRLALREAVEVFDVLSAETTATDDETQRAEYPRVRGIRRSVVIDHSRVAATILQRAIAMGGKAAVTGRIALPELRIELPLDKA
jgi:hypothetical protein